MGDGAPSTLAIDIGGTGLKASVLDSTGAMVHERVRVRTTYPCPPEGLVRGLAELVAQLPPADRIAVGFPGVVRHNAVLFAPHFVTVAGPGTANDPRLVAAWDHFDLGGAIARAFSRPTRVFNDADLQGLGVVKGDGVEMVLTFGTGFGTALFEDGRLAPRLELAHHRFRKGETYNEQLGDAARKRVGNDRWRRRVTKAVDNMRALTWFDRCYAGGGNAVHLGDTFAAAADVTVISGDAGILGGLYAWTGRYAGADSYPTAEPAS